MSNNQGEYMTAVTAGITGTLAAGTGVWLRRYFPDIYVDPTSDDHAVYASQVGLSVGFGHIGDYSLKVTFADGSFSLLESFPSPQDDNVLCIMTNVPRIPIVQVDTVVGTF